MTILVYIYHHSLAMNVWRGSTAFENLKNKTWVMTTLMFSHVRHLRMCAWLYNLYSTKQFVLRVITQYPLSFFSSATHRAVFSDYSIMSTWLYKHVLLWWMRAYIHMNLSATERFRWGSFVLSQTLSCCKRLGTLLKRLDISVMKGEDGKQPKIFVYKGNHGIALLKCLCFWC